MCIKRINPAKLYLLFCTMLFTIGVSNLHAQQKDTSKQKRYFDSTLFSDNTQTASDYLIEIEKVYQVLNKVPIVTSSFDKADDIADDLVQTDSALKTIKERYSLSDRTLNLRNLQMFQSLIQSLQDKGKQEMDELNKYDDRLDKLKKEILDFRKDTIVRHIFRDSILRKEFMPQLQGLRSKWRATDSLVRWATNLINNLKAQSSANSITLSELLYQTNSHLAKIGPTAFDKERPYLWEKHIVKPDSAFAGNFAKSINNEKKAVKYYFANTRTKRIWLILTGMLFFYWVWFNFRRLKKVDKLVSVNEFNFRYIVAVPIAASLVFMLNLAPLFDLHAPAIYIETVQFFLMLTLTGLFWKRWPHNIFFTWCIIVVLFLLLSVTRVLSLPFYVQRWWVLFIDIASTVAGILFLFQWKRRLAEGRLVAWACGLYVLLNICSVLCNLFGRLTLMQILGAAAIHGFVQAISLIVFVKLITEAFLLQIQASRMLKRYPVHFEYKHIAKGISNLIGLIAILLWSIVFSINLNLYGFFSDMLTTLFTEQFSLGSFSFTLGGVCLFLGIIWVANFLQKYIAYFFGDTGDDAAFDNKGARSRLVVTRLVLLILGFLLAVAASGLPVDKITVVLGALGVGIGLGLQSIVNNFVSGIILIFDRPLRIGDIVELGDKKGRVKEISVRSSTLLTADGAEVIIPNGDVLSHNIVNWTLSNSHMRAVLVMTIDKYIDPQDVKADIIALVQTQDNVLMNKEPEILITSLSSKIIELSISFWCKDITKSEATKSKLRAEVLDYLKTKGVNLV